MHRLFFLSAVLCLCTAAAGADTIYLKSDFVFVNVRCRTIVDGDVFADGTDREHRIPLSFIADIDTCPFDPSTPTQLLERSAFELRTLTAEPYDSLLRRYREGRIRVDLTGDTERKASSRWPAIGHQTFDRWDRWTALHNGVALSEESFFKLAGREKEALDVRRYRAGAGTLKIVGLAGIALSGVLFYLHSTDRKSSGAFASGGDTGSQLFPMYLAGAYAFGMGGLTCLFFGFERGNNCFPYSAARTAADEYNRTLVIGLQKTF